MADLGAITAAALDGRRLRLAGTYNVRHLGGYRTATGVGVIDGLIWRGDALHALDEDGRRTLAALGIRTIVDLREDAERSLRPNLVEGVGARSVALPLYGGSRLELDRAVWEATRAGDLTGLYRYLVAVHGAQIAAAIAELARPGALPALVHCTAGKDRTGLVVALLLSALGVGDDDILEDFALTERYLDAAFVASVRQATAGATAGGGELDDRVYRGADPAWIAAALTDVRDRHGDAASYLIDNGLPSDALEALHAAVTVPTTPEDHDV